MNTSEFKKMGSKVVNDEQYTPRVAVEPIIPYIISAGFKRIWCPFDTHNSEFVLCLRDAGIEVFFTHISTGADFLTYEPPFDFDAIVSNPPFSIKMQVLNRVAEIGKPFALLLSVPMLNYDSIGTWFMENGGLQLLLLQKKVSFDGNESSFKVSYFCQRFLPAGLLIAPVEHKNTGRKHIRSRMTLSP